MRCVVTGAAGFVGSTLCDRLLSLGYSVTGVDSFVEYYPRSVKERNLTGALASPKFSFIEGSVLNVDLSALLKDVELVFHQAGQAGVRASWGANFESYTTNNILASQRLLETLHGSKTLKKFVYASSSSVYGNAERFPTSETILPQPVSPYGVTKLAAEHLMGLYAVEFGVPTVSLRYFTVFGPRQRPDMAFNKFIQNGLQGKEITVYGDGEQIRDFTYVDDIVTANLLAAEKGSPGEVFNIGGGHQVTVNQVLTTIEKDLGALKVNRVERQVGDARRTCADTTRAREKLGYNPIVPLADGIREEIRWLRDIAKE